MTGSGIESDFVLPDSLSYRIIAHRQLSIRILAQTVVFFAQLACRRIHLRFFAPRTLPGALPLDSAKGSSTLWTPVCAIQLSAFSYCVRVFIGKRRKWRCPLTRSRDSVGDALMLCPRADPVSKRAAPACRDSPSNRQHSFQQEHLL